MSDLVPGFFESSVDLVKQGLHDILPVQHVPGLLIGINVVLDLSLKILVQFLVL